MYVAVPLNVPCDFVLRRACAKPAAYSLSSNNSLENTNVGLTEVEVGFLAGFLLSY